jgi:hypothetical protein
MSQEEKIHQDSTTILNTYTLSICTHNFKQRWLNIRDRLALTKY